LLIIKKSNKTGSTAIPRKTQAVHRWAFNIKNFHRLTTGGQFTTGRHREKYSAKAIQSTTGGITTEANHHNQFTTGAIL
jgi:hypothetical protein